MKGRMYDPSAGRFLSADPFMDPTQSQGLNPYSYVGNNPLNLTDPSGFLSFNDVMHTLIGGFVGLGHIGTVVASIWEFGGVYSLLSGGASGGSSMVDYSQLGGASGAGSPAGGFSQGGPHDALECAPGVLACQTRPWGSLPIDAIVTRFLETESPDIAMRLAGEQSDRGRPLTIGETLLEASAPEHAAAIIRTASGGYRLGPVAVSQAGNWNNVTLDEPLMTQGDQWVGTIHGHRGSAADVPGLRQSNADRSYATRLLEEPSEHQVVLRCWSCRHGPTSLRRHRV